jgi:hypothetical protein
MLLTPEYFSLYQHQASARTVIHSLNEVDTTAASYTSYSASIAATDHAICSRRLGEMIDTRGFGWGAMHM